MTEDELLVNICGATLALLAIVLFILIIMGARPFTYQKRTEGQNTCLTVTAKRNISRVSVSVKVGGEDVMFERRRVRKDQSVEFVYPSSQEKAKLTIELEGGKPRTFTV